MLKIFYHMPNILLHARLVIMPPFSIHSLYNAETAVKYKRKAEFCTLGSHPQSLYLPLPELAHTYSHYNLKLLSSYYLFFTLDVVNPWLGQLLTLHYITSRNILMTLSITLDR